MSTATTLLPAVGYEMRERGGVLYEDKPSNGIVDFRAGTGKPGAQSEFWGKDGFNFGDLVDIVNPLQHLPVVGSLYRAFTDDQISPGSRIAGGTLYGGPIGLASAVVSAAIEQGTGNDLIGNMVAKVTEPAAKNAPPVAQSPAVQTPVAQIPAAQTPIAPPPAGADRLTPAQQQAALAAARKPAPTLSPAAFQALMRSLNAKPAGQTAAPATAPVPAAAPRPKVTAFPVGTRPSAAAPAESLPSPAQHRRGMEMHQVLQGFYGTRKPVQ